MICFFYINAHRLKAADRGKTVRAFQKIVDFRRSVCNRSEHDASAVSYTHLVILLRGSHLAKRRFDLIFYWEDDAGYGDKQSWK